MSLNQVIPSTNAINNVGVFNGAVPPEGAKIIPQRLQFTAPNTGIEIDLTNIHQLGRFSGIQSVYIDNSANASPFSTSIKKMAMHLQNYRYIPIEDLTNIHQLGRFSGIQSVYIDNSANASPFSLSMFSTGQVVECPGNS